MPKVLTRIARASVSSGSIHGAAAHSAPFSGTTAQVMGAVGLCGIALTHLLDLPSKLSETPYLGVMFLGLIGVSLVVADLLLRNDSALLWAAAGSLALATALGYVVSRGFGLPGQPKDDLGNWGEPLGVASLFIEALVVWLAVRRAPWRNSSPRGEPTTIDLS